MLRLAEILMFLLPFAAYGVWLALGRRWSTQLLWGTVGAMVVMVVTAAWLELSGAVPPDYMYVAPHMDDDGRIVPGHAVRRPHP